MSDLAGLYNVPGTPSELLHWGSVHMAHHRDLNRRIYETANVVIPEYILDPIDVNDTGIWQDQHQEMHKAMDAVLGIQGYNLSRVDFKDKATLPGWIFFNASEHTQAQDILDQFSPISPEPPVSSVDAALVSQATSAASALSYPFVMSFGTPATDRYLLIALSYTGIRAATGVTVGGNAATRLIQASSANQLRSDLFMIKRPTGTVGTIVVLVNALSIPTTNGMAVSLFSITGRNKLGADGISFSYGSNPFSTINVAQYGAAIANVTAGSLSAPSWTNLSLATSLNFGPYRSTAASRNFSTASIGLRVQCSFASPGPSQNAGVFAVFNP